jgi:hypothetical protein
MSIRLVILLLEEVLHQIILVLFLNHFKEFSIEIELSDGSPFEACVNQLSN